jgi:hypothetical protein
VEKYFATYSWINDIYGWNLDDKWKWMNFFMNIGNKFVFVKNYTKETRWKKIMLVCFEKLNTWNVEVMH